MPDPVADSLAEEGTRVYRIDSRTPSATHTQRVRPTMVETLELGRDAMDRHAWAEAMDVFVAADSDGGLAPDDLERLGTAAWWAGQPDEATEALERAFAGYADAGRVERRRPRRHGPRVPGVSPPGRLDRRRAGSPGPSVCSNRSPSPPSHARLAVFHVARGADGEPASPRASSSPIGRWSWPASTTTRAPTSWR